jgi:hypothetical protein
MTDMCRKDENTQRYEYIAHQINREELLINNRLTWMLTLNGFLFATFALLLKSDPVTNSPTWDSTIFLLRWGLPTLGIFISLAGLLGVIAAQLQIKWLCRQWHEHKLDERQLWVRPFGANGASELGKLACCLPPVALMLMWFGLLITSSQF